MNVSFHDMDMFNLTRTFPSHYILLSPLSKFLKWHSQSSCTTPSILFRLRLLPEGYASKARSFKYAGRFLQQHFISKATVSVVQEIRFRGGAGQFPFSVKHISNLSSLLSCLDHCKDENTYFG